jgi:4-carboxymuconolactone decarboxylase
MMPFFMMFEGRKPKAREIMVISVLAAIGVAGRGWYQEEGKPAIEILPGTIIHIPANVKHWHGAAADSWFAHLAFEVPGEKTSNEWLEPVTDEEYDKLEQNKETRR